VLDEINERGQIVGHMAMRSAAARRTIPPRPRPLHLDRIPGRAGFARRGHYSAIGHPDAAPLGDDTNGLNDRGRIVGEFWDYLDAGVQASVSGSSAFARIRCRPDGVHPPVRYGAVATAP
jgi:hypothetical protein